MRPYDLRVNGRAEPRELDDPAPTFAWRLPASGPGVTVATFAVDVRRVDASGARDAVWSSGSIASDEVSVAYGGPPLGARGAYEWTVSLVATDGSRGQETARFETGVHGDWTARWIGRDPEPWLDAAGESVVLGEPTPIVRSWQTMYSQAPLQLRRRVILTRLPLRARLRLSAHGVYRGYVNGRRAGLDELTPGWNRYESRIEYQAYDVTESLRLGENVLAAQVADGWWSGYIGYNTRQHADQYGTRPELLAELHLDYADGSHEVIATDGAWRERPGDLVMSDLLMGEYRDSAMRTEGWLQPGYDDAGWRPAAVGEVAGAELIGQLAEPVRAVQTLAAVSITTRGDGRRIVDFGQNISGRVRLALRGQRAGAVIELRHAEVLDGGELYTDNLRTAEARDVVVASGVDGEVFEPLFTFHGFRYAEIAGWEGELHGHDVVAVVLTSDLRTTGTLETSSPLVDRLFQNIVWGQRGNFVSVPTDCPQRDERLGWTADAQVFAPTAALNSDVHAFLSRWLLDLSDSQEPNGNVPDVAPVPPTSENFSHGAPGWGDAAVIVPWTLYRSYGDVALLDRQFESMAAWVDHIARENPTTIWTNALGNNYGDWLSQDAHTPKLVVAAAYRIRSTDLVARAARVLGFDARAAYYEGEAARLRTLFQREFVDASGRVLGRTQTGYLFALAWDLVPEERRGELAAHLVADVEARGRRLSTGFLGASLLCSTLCEIGRSDLALDLLLQEEFPSWGYTIRQGATTIWERWDGYTDHGGFQTKEMNSFNHYSLGAVGEWLYSRLAGLAQHPDSAGYRSLRVEPVLTERFDFVRAAYESVRGRIVAGWRSAGEEWIVELELPPGTTAEVVLPTGTMTVASGVHAFAVPKALAGNESGHLALT